MESGYFVYDREGMRWIKTDRTPKVACDVYFKQAGIEPNIADDKNPFGYHVKSKFHKAALLKNLGLRETGDKIHGSRNSREK